MTQGFSLPFHPILTSFPFLSFCLSVIHHFPCGVIAFIFESITAKPSEVASLESNQLSSPLISNGCVLFWHASAGWLIFRVERKTTLQPCIQAAYFASCVCQDPPPVDTGHVGLRAIERAVCERERGSEGEFKRQI